MVNEVECYEHLRWPKVISRSDLVEASTNCPSPAMLKAGFILVLGAPSVSASPFVWQEAVQQATSQLIVEKNFSQSLDITWSI